MIYYIILRMQLYQVLLVLMYEFRIKYSFFFFYFMNFPQKSKIYFLVILQSCSRIIFIYFGMIINQFLNLKFKKNVVYSKDLNTISNEISYNGFIIYLQNFITLFSFKY